MSAEYSKCTPISKPLLWFVKNIDNEKKINGKKLFIMKRISNIQVLIMDIEHSVKPYLSDSYIN